AGGRAGKSRRADSGDELETGGGDVEDKQQGVNTAQAEITAAADAETAARNNQRNLQHQALAARERHAEAEREASRNAARLSALSEAKARLTASRDEATGARDEATPAIEP